MITDEDRSEEYIIQNPTEKIVEYIDRYIDRYRLIYNDVNITEFLIALLYIKNERSYITNVNNGLKLVSWLRKMRNYFLYTMSFIRLNIINKKEYELAKNNDKIWGRGLEENNSYANKKYIFVQAYEEREKHGFVIIDNLLKGVQGIISKDEVLLITPYKSNLMKYSEYDVICLETSKMALFNEKIPRNYYKELEIEELRVLSIGFELFEKANSLFRKMNSARMLFTAQDFHFYEQAFSKAAKKNGILSITHQHGLMDYPHPGIFKYMFSDYIMVWGKNSMETLEKYIGKEKIKVVGTDKFNYLTKNLDYEREEVVTVALNFMNEEDLDVYMEKLVKGFKYLKFEQNLSFDVIFKLHPIMGKLQEWIENIIKLKFSKYEIVLDYKIVVGDIAKTLAKSKYLIATRSTISIEAMICNSSVLEINYPVSSLNRNSLFQKFQESIVSLDNFYFELGKRMVDFKYSNEILAKQRTVIKSELESLSLQKEVEFIQSLLNSI